MDRPLLSSLESLDTALQRLNESLSAQTPLLPAAQQILEADGSLTSCLSDLTTHTSNSLQISHLRSLADSLAAAFQSQLKTLAEVRSEIVASKVGGPVSIEHGETVGKNDAGQGVVYQDVLAFARNLSRHTAPRAFKAPSQIRAEMEAANPVPKTVVGENGVTSTADQSKARVEAEAANATNLADDQPDQSRNPALHALDDNYMAWLNPSMNAPFLPWPSQEMVARSSLARTTGWIGAIALQEEIDPEEKLRIAAQEQEEKLRKEEEEKRQVERYHEMQRHAAQQKPKVFMGMEDFEDDD